MNQPYVPNQIPLADRVVNGLLAVFLLGWGALGFVREEIIFLGRRTIHAVLFDRQAWLMAAAFVCGALILVSVIVDHYDRRNNEASYKIFRFVVIRLGWCLAAASLLSYLYLFFSGARMR